MNTKIRYVGLEVHQDSIKIGVAESGRSKPELVDTVGGDWLSVAKVLGRLGPKSRLRLCYEAGPTGFGLARRLCEAGYDCRVIAPSLVPVQQGCRVKTDRRDAMKLARFLRSGDLVEVAIPDRQTEALRDLERSRDDAKRAEKAARQQLDKFLLRHGRIWSGKSKWTQQHMRWIRQQSFSEEAQRRVLQDYVHACEQRTARVAQLDADLEELVYESPLGPIVRAFQGLRGVRVLTATVLAAEVGNFQRFAKAEQFMAFLGLVPSEYSTGRTRRQGRITRTGNRHVRRLLIEAAWHYRHPPWKSKILEARRQRLSVPVRSIAEKAERRLHRRWNRMLRRGKLPNVAITAVARELAGFVWAIAQEETLLAT
jgi:transposase